MTATTSEETSGAEVLAEVSAELDADTAPLIEHSKAHYLARADFYDRQAAAWGRAFDAAPCGDPAERLAARAFIGMHFACQDRAREWRRDARHAPDRPV